MQHLGVVGVLHRLGQAEDESGRLARVQRPVEEAGGQAAAGHELHAEEDPAGVLSGREDADHAGVVEPGNGLLLDLEAGLQVGPGQGAGADQLEGHHPVQVELAGLVDDAHAALAQQAGHLEAGQGQVDGRPGTGIDGGHAQRRFGRVAGAGRGVLAQLRVGLAQHPPAQREGAGEGGEAGGVLGPGGELAALQAEEDLVGDQPEQGRVVAGQGGVRGQVVLDADVLPPAPALRLVGAQLCEE